MEFTCFSSIIVLYSYAIVVISQDLESPRIVGGYDCKKDYPFMVSLQRNGFHTCGGTLIHQQWILTAAHCDFKFYAVIGNNYIYSNGTIEGIKIDYIVKHPRYDGRTINNDIAMAHLKEPVDYIQPVLLASKDVRDAITKICRTCTVMGWGVLSNVGISAPNNLQCVSLKTMTTENCRKKLGFWFSMFTSLTGTICASARNKYAASGDSGGPLMCGEVQYGIVSASSENGGPGIYSSVGYHLKFISQTINKGNQNKFHFRILCLVLLLHK